MKVLRLKIKTPENNHVSNLEWATHKENNMHANKTGLRKYSYDRFNKRLTLIKIKGNG